MSRVSFSHMYFLFLRLVNFNANPHPIPLFPSFPLMIPPLFLKSLSPLVHTENQIMSQITNSNVPFPLALESIRNSNIHSGECGFDSCFVCAAHTAGYTAKAVAVGWYCVRGLMIILHGHTNPYHINVCCVCVL